MTTKITISLTLDTNAPAPKDVQNAVRRATEALTVTGAVLVPDVPVVAKGVTIRTRPAKTVQKAYSPIREWAQNNGYPEVAGKRGRIAKNIIEAYNTANG